jgi:hypothetical protein
LWPTASEVKSAPIVVYAPRLTDTQIEWWRSRAADLWVQASLEQRQRFQQLFFPEGIAFDGTSFVRTAVTAPAFSYLRSIEDENERVVDYGTLPSAAERWAMTSKYS